MQRGQFSSRLAFILAASGSAVGLGNIWGFPTSAAENGGGAFLLMYLILAFALAYPALMAELIIGPPQPCQHGLGTAEHGTGAGQRPTRSGHRLDRGNHGEFNPVFLQYYRRLDDRPYARHRGPYTRPRWAGRVVGDL